MVTTDLDIHLGDNLDVLPTLPAGAFDLIYIDPPFNTGRAQPRRSVQTLRDAEGDRLGFHGERYRTVRLGSRAFADRFDDFLAFLEPRIEHAHRLLAPTGSFFLHLDYREVHYAKVLTDAIFGRDSFVNEIVWAYDNGAPARDARDARARQDAHRHVVAHDREPDRPREDRLSDAEAARRARADRAGPQRAR